MTTPSLHSLESSRFSPTFLSARPRQFWALVCALLFVATLIRYRVSYDPSDTVPQDPESFRIARNLAEKGHFANPFVPLETGPTAHMAPAFPAILALLIRLFGDGSVAAYTIKLSAVFLLAVQLAIFPLFSRALGMGEFTGVVAAIIWLAAKIGLAYPHDRAPVVMFGWESFYAAILVAIGVCCLPGFLRSSRTGSSRMAWFLGLLLGALALTSPTAGVIFVFWLVWAAWKEQPIVIRKSNLPVLLLPAIMLSPWIIRNYLVFDRVILTRDNFGLELSVSNNDCAMFGIVQNLENGCFAKVHPNGNLDEARKVLAYGEPNYNQMKLSEARDWIGKHPARFFELSAQRFMAFWMPPATGGPYSLAGPGRRLERLAVYLMTCLAVPGLYILYRRDSQSAALCAICLGFYPMVYYVVQYEYRYRYPILWVTFLLGALPIAALAQHTFRSFAPYGSSMGAANVS